MPSCTSSAGSTPDSRSRIIQPSVRTVSLTQKGIRHSTNRSDLMRPRTSLAIVQATGKASSSVISVARMDMLAVRTKVCQYSGSSINVRYCARLGTYCRGATRSRSDSTARSICGSTIRPSSQISAGASSSQSISRACTVADAAFAAIALGAARGKADRLLRIKTEGNGLANAQIGKTAGLRQRDAKFHAAGRLTQQNG